MAAGSALHPEAGGGAGAESAAGSFVINLCSSTTPMALAHPDSPELKRFSFFVSRRREDNRERFRLHMGYFTTLAEAEEWLSVIRDLYPGAWAGEAPGKKLRARAAAAALADELPAPPTAAPTNAVQASAQRVVSVAPAAVNRTPAPAAAPVAARPAAPSAKDLIVPTLQAAPAAATIMTPVLAAVPAPKALPATPVQSRPAAKVAASAPSAQVPAPRSPQIPPKQPAAAAPPVQQPVKKPTPNALTGSNVREVMASLDETGETRQMRVPPGLRSPSPAGAALSNARVQSPSASNARVSDVRAQGPAAPTASSLSDTQVLKILEQRRADNGERVSDDANAGISLLKPDDTQTRRALKEAVQENAPVAFAVQLYWSVQPVELEKVPPLAIFSAYTLYTVEGSREGRKWYGLRLGFFSDAISAKQVAYYVRSEFTSVAVVPVSPQEKSGASDEETKAATGAFQKKQHVDQKIEEFKLFDESAVSDPAPVAPKQLAARTSARAAPAKKNKPLGRVRAKEQRPAKTLEETLEILGASELEIDNGRGETLNDTGVRHLRVEVQKNTPFGKLLDRLSERVRKN
jgi:hypothetical protein